jgi:Patatin-like phospholipase/Protein of unknown function, DUF
MHGRSFVADDQTFALKRCVGLAPRRMSWSTAKVDGYFVEGRFPAEDMKRPFPERPDARGMTAPGMPPVRLAWSWATYVGRRAQSGRSRHLLSKRDHRRAARTSRSGCRPEVRGFLTIGALLGRLLVVFTVVSGCTQTILRAGVPVELTEEARPLGLDGLRSWGDRSSPAEIQQLIQTRVPYLKQRFVKELEAGQTPELNYLALSGGGQHGAFGAGVINAWTDSGERPVFDAVSGISTGALIAPFAYLGPEYDDELKEFYTTISTDDVLIRTIFSGITGGTALASTAPLRAKIEEYITPEVLEKIAAEHRKGRLLFIGTTNLDVSRPVVWDMGAIAASGHPDALKLFHDVIQASAAIPVAFPPVFIEVEAAGRSYDEMHVDGGVTSQVTLVSPQIPIYQTDELLGHKIDRNLYVLVNGRIVPAPSTVPPRITAIAPAAINSTYAGTVSDLYKIYAVVERDDMDAFFAWTPEAFVEVPSDQFDQIYMNKLYDYGYELAASGKLWSPYPPFFAPRRDESRNVEEAEEAGVIDKGAAVGSWPTTSSFH